MSGTHPQVKAAEEFIDKIGALARTDPQSISILLHENGAPVFGLAARQPMKMLSTQKMVLGLAYARDAVKDPALAAKTFSLDAIDRVNPAFGDGGAHAAWKASLSGKSMVTLEEITQGMMMYSSNACTQFMMDHLGTAKMNAIIHEQGLSMEHFVSKFTKAAAQSRASADDMVKLIEQIATHEPEAVRGIIKSIAPITLSSVDHGMANGFAKGGSWCEHGLNDLTHISCAHSQDGKRVSMAFFTNDLKAADNAYLSDRMAEFLCESHCNPGFRARCANTLEHTRVPTAAMEQINTFAGNALKHLRL